MKLMKLIFLLLFGFAFAQSEGFKLQSEVKKETITFKFINNLIFIPLTINGVELTFLLDTGVTETLLFSLGDKSVNFNEVEKAKFTGLGGNLEIEGLKSINNQVKAGKYLEDHQHTLYIILDEQFNFSSHVGIPVNGIIGYQFFRNHPVQIDYVNHKITIYQDQKNYFPKIKKHKEFPITIEGNKPYMWNEVEMTNEKKASKLLIDLGNSDAIWLFPTLIKDFVYNRPNIDDFLGRGFNGDIYGKRSRIHNFYIGDFKFEKPMTAMPDEFSIQHVNMAKDRKGSVGSEIIRRFNIIIDYKNAKIFLKKNKFYSEPFQFNMSGLDFKHHGVKWEKEFVRVETPKKNTAIEGTEVINNAFQYKIVLKNVFAVAGVRKDSPAYIAGLQKDDILVTVNGKKAESYTLENLIDLMKAEEGKKIDFTITRKGETKQFTIMLEDPIPYTEN